MQLLSRLDIKSNIWRTFSLTHKSSLTTPKTTVSFTTVASQQEDNNNMKYVLVTGGVVSGLGKGVTASSVGVVLKACGLRVTSIKIGTHLFFIYMCIFFCWVGHILFFTSYPFVKFCFYVFLILCFVLRHKVINFTLFV